jgi:pyrroloquinoline quinone biosynthesis protein B
MVRFLENNGPWSQLVRLENIALRALSNGVPVALNGRINVTPFLVPHRDEYTETVGYRIDGPDQSVLYISDIDKWHLCDRSIVEAIAGVSVAYLDATFYAGGEIPGRNMAGVPHPFIEESMELFASMPAAERAKVRFIHLNHTNPALAPDSDACRRIAGEGYAVAGELETFGL